MKLMRVFLVIFFIFLTLSVSAKVIEKDTRSFKDVVSVIKAKVKKHGAQKVLMVFDLDDTLLTSSTDFGSDLWYRWQRDKLTTKPCSDEKVPADAIFDIIGMILETGTMMLIENKAPKQIELLQQKGVASLILTSRNPKFRNATEREVNRYYKFNEFGLVPKKRTPSEYFLEIILKEEKNGEIRKTRTTYLNGIFMTKGFHKGKALEEILKRVEMPNSLKAIIFVDDGIKNITNVQETYKEMQNIDVTTIHYTRVDEMIRPLSTCFIKRVNRSWYHFKSLLQNIFPERWKLLTKDRK